MKVGQTITKNGVSYTITHIYGHANFKYTCVGVIDSSGNPYILSQYDF